MASICCSPSRERCRRLLLALAQAREQRGRSRSRRQPSGARAQQQVLAHRERREDPAALAARGARPRRAMR